MLGCGRIPTFNLTFNTLRGGSGAFFAVDIYTMVYCHITSFLFCFFFVLFFRETRSHMFLIVLPSSISLESRRLAGQLHFTLIPSFTEPPPTSIAHPDWLSLHGRHVKAKASHSRKQQDNTKFLVLTSAVRLKEAKTCLIIAHLLV